MLFEGWYTDTADIFRVRNVAENNVTSQKREKQNAGPVPCRVYTPRRSGPTMEKGAASIAYTEKLAFPPGTDVRAGDELWVTRGGNIGKPGSPERYFAGSPQQYHDPAGGAFSGLGHIEAAISADKIIR